MDRVYTFLAGLGDVFDKVSSDILRTQPLPYVEEVFSVVRREAQHHATMMGGNNLGSQIGALTPTVAMVSRPLSASRPYGSSLSTPSRPFTRENKDNLKCTFCSQTRHTEDTCFQKHGVLEWFPELKQKLRANERATNGASRGRASIATAGPSTKEVVPTPGDLGQSLLTKTTPSDSLSNTRSMGRVLLASDMEHHTGWILDSGVTDHMTFDKSLFKCMTMTPWKAIATANGTMTLVLGAGTVDLMSALSLHHCLLVPSLSHNLLSILQVTEQLDCVVLMYPLFCFEGRLHVPYVAKRTEWNGPTHVGMSTTCVRFQRLVFQPTAKIHWLLVDLTAYIQFFCFVLYLYIY